MVQKVSILCNLKLPLLQKCVSPSFFGVFSRIKVNREVWKHTWDTCLWFQNQKNTTKQSLLASLWVKKARACWSEAIHTYKPSGINSPPFSTPTPVLPNQNKWKSWRERKGEKEVAKCQHVLQQLLRYEVGFALCRSDVTGTRSVKSQQVWLLFFNVYNDLPKK